MTKKKQATKRKNLELNLDDASSENDWIVENDDGTYFCIASVLMIFIGNKKVVGSFYLSFLSFSIKSCCLSFTLEI